MLLLDGCLMGWQVSGGMPPDILAGDLGRGLPAQFRVRPDVVVAMPPGIEHEAGVCSDVNSVLVMRSSWNRPLKLSTKPFCMGLPGACRAIRRGIPATSAGWRLGQLGAIVANHRMRLAAQPDQPRQFARDPNARQRRVDHQRKTFPRVIIDHAQDTEATAARQRV